MKDYTKLYKAVNRIILLFTLLMMTVSALTVIKVRKEARRRAVREQHPRWKIGFQSKEDAN